MTAPISNTTQTMLPWWVPLISAGSVIVGAIIGAVATWKITKQQITKNTRMTFLSAGLQSPGWTTALSDVLTRLYNGETQGLREQCENQNWFMYLTVMAPENREKILNNLSEGKPKEALKEFHRLLSGEWD